MEVAAPWRRFSASVQEEMRSKDGEALDSLSHNEGLDEWNCFQLIVSLHICHAACGD